MPSPSDTWSEDGIADVAEPRGASHPFFDAHDALDIEEDDPMGRESPTADAEEEVLQEDEAQAYRSQSAVWEREEDMEEDGCTGPVWEENGIQEDYWEEEATTPPLSNGMEEGGPVVQNTLEVSRDGGEALDDRKQREELEEDQTAERPSPPGKLLLRVDTNVTHVHK